MASSKSICIDYAGRKIEKKLSQSRNPSVLIDNLLLSNNLKIITKSNLNGYSRFKCKYKKTKKIINFNIFSSNYKFDIERPDWVNINLGTTADDPYELSQQDNEFNLTLILGIYVFDEDDGVQDAIFVNCPIKKRNYKGNPSIRARIELIQEARLNSDAIFTNNANDSFRAFKPLIFLNVIDVNSLGSRSSLYEQQTKFVEVGMSKKKGPPPSSKSYIVRKKDNCEGLVYAAQWGKTNIWKIGTTNNIERRLKQFNQYIPNHANEIPSQEIWTMVISRKFETQKKAYDIEQKILNDPSLRLYWTSGERFKCHFLNIQKAINKYCF